VNEACPAGEHDLRRVVYRRSMNPVLVVLLLAAAQADGQVGEAPTPTPATTAPQQQAQPQPEAATTLPEATAPQQAKPEAPRQQLRILAQDSRLEAYQQFRTLYDQARYDEALPVAKRVVELSEASEDRDHELPIAFNNLGATQYQLADYAAAEGSYRTSLELLESTQGISSRRLVVPLAGLGAAYAAQDKHEVAAELFDRALAVSRRADGLFNLQQLPLLVQAADSRYAISDFSGAEREHLYTLKIAEQNFGYGDARTLPALIGLGAFYESLREFIAARNMYMRARDVALKPGVYDPQAVKALLGIARTHRLQYTVNPDTLASQQPARDEATGDMSSMASRESRVTQPAADRTGLKAAQNALDLLRSTSSPPPSLVTETLIELGDWFQATSRPAMALPYYEEAAAILDAQVAADPLAGHPLKAPRMVFYRPPLSASRGLNAVSGQYVVRKTVFSFVVTETGLPLDIGVVSTDMDEGQLSQSRRAVSRAIYSPRFSEGRAVSTAGVTFTGEWYQQYDPESAPPDAAPNSTAPAETSPGPEPEPATPPPTQPGTTLPSGS
jgi:tetratricopeptide (TPR) repeat protein